MCIFLSFGRLSLCLELTRNIKLNTNFVIVPTGKILNIKNK